MTPRLGAPASTCVALALGIALASCFDLFHSTGDVLTACQADPSSMGCVPDATPASTVQSAYVCAASSSEARQAADRVCAWLGACEGPIGNNAFGPCVVQARMAYDCEANPNHRVRGAALTVWACMLDVSSCADVGRCIDPACGDDGGTSGGENCEMWGKECGQGPAGSDCVGGPGGPLCAPSCDINNGTLHWCTGSGATTTDIGIDCASYGAGTCNVFPASAQWAACVAASDAGPSGACVPSATAECDGGIASSCPSGVSEVLDCATILGTPGACTPGPLDPPFDWTSPCSVSHAQCQADSCEDAGGVLTGCARGAAFAVACGAEGLGPCRLSAVPVGTDGGVAARAACTPP